MHHHHDDAQLRALAAVHDGEGTEPGKFALGLAERWRSGFWYGFAAGLMIGGAALLWLMSVVDWPT